MLNQTSTSVGIIIPTKDRADFIIRQLRYYASVGCQHIIYIGDSSSKEESEKIGAEIKRLNNKIKTKYYYLPLDGAERKYMYLISQVKEKYTCLSGDDDYQIPKSITKCAEFLEANPEYSTASGYAVSFRLKRHGVYGELLRLADYPRRQIEDATGTERIINFFNNFNTTNFSVIRTDYVQKYLRGFEKITDRQFLGELLPCSLPLIYGKSKIIDCLGFVRQIHDRHYGLPNFFDWITSSDLHSSYISFEKEISESLAVKDNISIKDATAVIKQSFWAHLQKYLSKEYEACYHPKTKSGLIKQVINSIKSKIARAIPVLKPIYRMVIKPAITGNKELNFEVLQPRSKYYQDFKPVMNSFTGKNKT